MTSHPPESPYLQAPLDLTGSTFRLVELQPCGPTDLIKCRLTTHPLPPESPPFVALSYMWDHTSPKDMIELNGILFAVGHSLWTFLDEMRSQGKFSTYWIDAICIDQSNIGERNHQVQLMKNIYSEAQSVYIWLGPAEEGSRCIEAMDFLKGLSDHVDTLWEPLTLTKLQTDSMVALCRCAYWERMWIVQEVVLAQEAALFYGSQTASWTNFRFVVCSCHWHFFKINAPDSWRFCRDLCDLKSDPKRWGLQYSIVFCKDRKASDIRDRIYALIGLADADSFGIRVDYQVSCPKLWEVVVLHLWNLSTAKEFGASTYTLFYAVALALELRHPHEYIDSFMIRQSIGWRTRDNKFWNR